MSDILKGIKVVEMSTFMAAPVAGKQFAQYGASVIKIDPIYGDPFYYFGRALQMSTTDEENPVWQWTHADKKEIAVDYKTPEGIEIIHKLLSEADVFLTNFRPYQLEQAGLLYEQIKDVYPKLVYAWVTGYGLEGPWKDDPGFDSVAFFVRPGFLLGFGDHEVPVSSPGTLGDIITGNNLFLAAVLGLWHRNTTGVGELVDTSLYGTGIFINSMHIQTGGYYGFEYPRGQYERFPLMNPYKTKDGKFVIMNLLNLDVGWAPFALEFGLDPEDPRFKNMVTVWQAGMSAHETIESTFAQYTADELLAKLANANVPAALLEHFKDVATAPQALEAGYLEPYTFASGSTQNMAMNSIHFSNDEKYSMGPAPLFGENTRELLAEIGYTSEQIDEFLASKKVFSRE